jgi:serine/threonine protein kinase
MYSNGLKDASKKSGFPSEVTIKGRKPEEKIRVNVQKLEALGKGGFGTVYKASGDDGEEYAVKFADTKKRDAIKGECLFFREFKEKTLPEGLLPIRYASEENGLVIMDYCPSALGKDKDKSKEICQNPTKLKGLVKALKYLHSNGFTHNDIKPNNILIDGNGRLVLCDYGLTRKHQNEDCIGPIGGGTPAFLPPDYFLSPPGDPKIFSMRQNNKSRDVFALGITLFVILTGKSMEGFLKKKGFFTEGRFLPKLYHEDGKFIEEEMKAWLDSKNIPETIKDIIIGATKMNPAERLTTEQIIGKLEKMEEKEKEKAKNMGGIKSTKPAVPSYFTDSDSDIEFTESVMSSPSPLSSYSTDSSSDDKFIIIKPAVPLQPPLPSYSTDSSSDDKFITKPLVPSPSPSAVSPLSPSAMSPLSPFLLYTSASSSYFSVYGSSSSNLNNSNNLNSLNKKKQTKGDLGPL